MKIFSWVTRRFFEKNSDVLKSESVALHAIRSECPTAVLLEKSSEVYFLLYSRYNRPAVYTGSEYQKFSFSYWKTILFYLIYSLCMKLNIQIYFIHFERKILLRKI